MVEVRDVNAEELEALVAEGKRVLIDFYFDNCAINTKLVSKIDDTVKYLFTLPDGEYVESVVMKYKYGYSRNERRKCKYD